MDKFEKNMLEFLRDKYLEQKPGAEFQVSDGARAYYLEDLKDNLIVPMSDAVKAQYGAGSGGEIDSGKMNALRSSSAMTFNLLGNNPAEINGAKSKENCIGSGTYDVEFEKQFYTLKTDVSNRPANLDAFLYCADTKEAIACEMKMMEWLLNAPGKLKEAYLNPDNYIDSKAGIVFVDVAKKLIDSSVEKKEDGYKCIMKRYDAFQMFKHTVACYNAAISSAEEKRPFNKLTLVNCVWMPSEDKLPGEKFSEKYNEKKEQEHKEFEQFKEIMEDVKPLFADVNVDFEICFYTVDEFLNMLKKNPEELDALHRYIL